MLRRFLRMLLAMRDSSRRKDMEKVRRVLVRMGALLVLGAWAPGSIAALELNNAPQADLEMVKGIGPALSQRIIDERRKAPFKDWADALSRVSGLGSHLARQLSHQGVVVDGQPYEPGSKGSR
jgi:competence protein ComEA